MPEVEIRVHPSELENADRHKTLLAKSLRLDPKKIESMVLQRRSIDSRKSPVYVLRYIVNEESDGGAPGLDSFPYQNVSDREEVGIIGFGPAGMFAALKLIELGYKPVIMERGKAVRDRRRDLASLNKEGVVNPDSNYCFGEGGAGTFSDGKLYTRSKKRGDVRRVLEVLVAHGASPDILIDAHPHIGTNKLPQIIQSMRETILDCGGEVMFECKVVDFDVVDDKVRGVEFSDGSKRSFSSVIMATGHSARDIFEIFWKRKWAIEAKQFAMGVRVEHPQGLIDQIQYHCDVRHENLPAAAYSWVQQEFKRGVYSFCMCPGGIICPAATAPGEVVVNGWSPSKRNSPFANSGIVVETRPEDFKAFESFGPLAGMKYQAALEQQMASAGGGKQVAPAMRLTDFIAGKHSADLPDCSYLPGITPAPLDQILPYQIVNRLRSGFADQGRRMKGYISEESVIVAIESRTSSPVKIPRDSASLMHPEIAGLYPCGEGAGYAGGIMSAAIDGEKCAVAVGIRTTHP